MSAQTLLVSLIRKWRWIGMDEEARELEQMLRRVPAVKRSCVLAEPTNTD